MLLKGVHTCAQRGPGGSGPCSGERRGYALRVSATGAAGSGIVPQNARWRPECGAGGGNSRDLDEGRAWRGINWAYGELGGYRVPGATARERPHAVPPRILTAKNRRGEALSDANKTWGRDGGRMPRRCLGPMPTNEGLGGDAGPRSKKITTDLVHWSAAAGPERLEGPKRRARRGRGNPSHPADDSAVNSARPSE